MITDPVVLMPVKEPKYYKTIKVAEGARQEVRFILTDTEGRVLDLSGMDPVKASKCQDTGDGIDAVNPGFPDGIHPKGPWPDVSIRLVVSQSQSTTRSGVISIPEVRLFLRDLDPSFNDVMEELEFKDAEIMACIRKPVDMWNEFLPYEPLLQFRYTDFPFRGNWLRAATGYLLEMAAHWYRRNDIPMSAGGVQIQDRNKHLTYEPKSRELIEEFMSWGKQYKAACSARMAFGSIGSTWPQSTIY